MQRQTWMHILSKRTTFLCLSRRRRGTHTNKQQARLHSRLSKDVAEPPPIKPRKRKPVRTLFSVLSTIAFGLVVLCFIILIALRGKTVEIPSGLQAKLIDRFEQQLAPAQLSHGEVRAGLAQDFSPFVLVENALLSSQQGVPV